MLFKFGKEFNDNGIKKVTVTFIGLPDDSQIRLDAAINGNALRNADVDICVFDNLLEASVFDRILSIKANDRDYEILNKKMNDEYRTHCSRVNKKKVNKAVIKLADHWYLTLDNKTKTELANRLRLSLSRIVNDMLDRNPHDFLATHYQSLVNRAECGNIDIESVVETKKLIKFPLYDERTGELYGANYRFIAMAECVFPANRRIRTHTINRV